MNLLTAYQADMSQAMENIFDSFARDVTVTFYKAPTENIVSFDPDYNSAFPESSTTVEYTTQSQSFPCRIWYLERQEYSNFIEGGEDLGVKGKTYYNRVRLQCKVDAFEYLKESERFVFLGEKYQIETAWERIGAGQSFAVYQVILRRVN
jgi:hypothetical protein